MAVTDFISKRKSLIVAPAGYGKTYYLATCLSETPENEKQLILTHTHAGIASIKQKIKELSIPTSKYHIETITGFAQKYVLAYYCGNDIPEMDKPNKEGEKYFTFIVKKAIEILRLKPVKKTISYSYQGLFVDEYQDCTVSQHQMIMSLAEVLPTHILGDPLQGIFGFGEPLVEIKTDLYNFEEIDELTTPWRWYSNGNNKELGDKLKEIRTVLTNSNKLISITSYDPIITFVKISESDIHDSNSNYRKCLTKLITNPQKNTDFNSLLLVVPEYIENNIPKGRIDSRAKLKTQIDFSNQLILLEAIDDKKYYSISKSIDSLVTGINRKNQKVKALNKDVFSNMFNSSCINKWIKEDRLIDKRGTDRILKIELDELINAFLSDPSIHKLLSIILFLKNKLKFKSQRRDLVNSIIKAMRTAMSEEKSVYESMVSHKNIIRRVGRKVYGKCLGTTLLTKGLEFDTVAILDAHRIENPKHLYVALTRACKKLIVFSEKETLCY
jgi:DNA helicase-2/ATP-dependent DNA helicase PcrA